MKIFPEILYEDEHLFAVHKPNNMLTVPAPNFPENRTLQGKVRAWALKEEKDFTPYLLHRLDRDTSGIVLLGKYSKDREALENIFRDDKTKKTYMALVKGHPKSSKGSIRFPLEARTAKIKVPAVTHYRIKERFKGVTLLEVQIETGRKHQIRKHLAMIHCPLVLDRLYGDRHFNAVYKRKQHHATMVLQACRIEFVHPITGKTVVIHDSGSKG